MWLGIRGFSFVAPGPRQFFRWIFYVAERERKQRKLGNRGGWIIDFAGQPALSTVLRALDGYRCILAYCFEILIVCTFISGWGGTLWKITVVCKKCLEVHWNFLRMFNLLILGQTKAIRSCYRWTIKVWAVFSWKSKKRRLFKVNFDIKLCASIEKSWNKWEYFCSFADKVFPFRNKRQSTILQWNFNRFLIPRLSSPAIILKLLFNVFKSL